MTGSPSSVRSPSRVLVLTTGGTIASRTRNGRKVYPTGNKPLPGLAALGRGQALVDVQEIASIGSQDISLDVWRKLLRHIKTALADAAIDGVVITHGTDTLEETAFLLDCLLAPGAPVVLVGAMRPADAPDADGPANLRDAIAIAIDPASRDRGVLVAMAGAIHGARDVRKEVVNGAHALASSGDGALGEIVAGKPRYFAPPRPPGLAGRFSLPEFEALPRVAILHGAADMVCEPEDFVFAKPLAGVVTAGFGHGNLPQPVIRTLAHLVRNGLLVVRSTRVAGARVDEDGEVDDAAFGFIVSRMLSPAKSRLLLQLMLAAGSSDAETIQQAFDTC